MRVEPLTIRPKLFNEGPIQPVVHQKPWDDLTFGRIETTRNYRVRHAIAFGKNRDEIVIEETSSLHKPAAKNDEEFNLLKRKSH